MLTASGTENVRTANARNVDVLRNGRDATVAQIQPGDQVTVTLDADNVPTRIVARSQQTGGGETPSPLPLLALLPLFLLMRNNDEQPTIRQRQTRRG